MIFVWSKFHTTLNDSSGGRDGRSSNPGGKDGAPDPAGSGPSGRRRAGGGRRSRRAQVARAFGIGPGRIRSPAEQRQQTGIPGRRLDRRLAVCRRLPEKPGRRNRPPPGRLCPPAISGKTHGRTDQPGGASHSAPGAGRRGGKRNPFPPPSEAQFAGGSLPGAGGQRGAHASGCGAGGRISGQPCRPPAAEALFHPDAFPLPGRCAALFYPK